MFDSFDDLTRYYKRSISIDKFAIIKNFIFQYILFKYEE